ncbi:MAG: hypothetical protein V4477_22495 [Pseudomonadota bacterium]
MAETFNRAIHDELNEVPYLAWRILQPPTGTGKTRGACLFLAMQAERNVNSVKPIGSIIVTRLIEDAEAIALEINQHAGRDVAIAHHSQAPKSLEELQRFDTLVITHQACVNASASLGAAKGSAFERLCLWRGGKRLLTIIDEALANVVDDVKVTPDNIAEVQRYITSSMSDEFPTECSALALLSGMLAAYERHEGGASVVFSEGINAPHAEDPLVNFAPLRAAMRGVAYDLLGAHMQDADMRLSIWRNVDRTLEACQALYSQWLYYAKSGDEHSLNSSSLSVPWGIPGPVVLDATARAEFLWDLLEDKARIVLTPSHVRDYGSVKLYVARCKGVGKRTMTASFKQRFARLADDLEQRLPRSSSVFLCTHQANEPSAKAAGMDFQRFSVGHWGAVDGKNDWTDHDTAVIFGLPYRDQTWANNTFFATQGVQDDEWLKQPKWKVHADVRRVMMQRQLSVSAIQAINRIRLRRVVDAEGRCPEANVFIVLPPDNTGDAILKSITDDMPGLKVVDWPFEMDGPKVRRPRKGSSHAALLSMMESRLPGRMALSHVARELSLGAHAMRALKETLRDREKDLTKALNVMGVEYLVEGHGRGAKTFLLKRHAA